MPKKTRREKLRAARRPMNLPPAQPAPTSLPSQAVAGSNAPVAAASVSRASVPARTLTFDYSYVYRDLRRILVLAVSFFILLIVLSFVIR